MQSIVHYDGIYCIQLLVMEKPPENVLFGFKIILHKWLFGGVHLKNKCCGWNISLATHFIVLKAQRRWVILPQWIVSHELFVEKFESNEAI